MEKSTNKLPIGAHIMVINNNGKFATQYDIQEYGPNYWREYGPSISEEKHYFIKGYITHDDIECYLIDSGICSTDHWVFPCSNVISYNSSNMCYKLVKPECYIAVNYIAQISDKGYDKLKDQYHIISEKGIHYKSGRLIYSSKEDIAEFQRIKESGVLDIWFEPVYFEEKPQLPEINGYKGEIIGNNIVKYGCQQFTFEFIKNLVENTIDKLGLIDDVEIRVIGDLSIPKIKVKQIEEIYNILDLKNK